MSTPKIGLCHGKGFVSALIRWQTRGDFSHALILYEDGQTIIESWQGAGVREKKLGDETGITWFDVTATPEQWAQAVAFAKLQLGHKYDWFGVVGFISRGRMPDNEAWFCSELVFASLEAAGVKLFERIEAWAVSPSLLAISPLVKPLLVATSAVTPL